MNKPKPLGIEAKSRKITVKMFLDVKQSLPLQIAKDGYNMREKSVWIADSVRSLMNSDGWENVLVSEIDVKPDGQDVFTMPTDLMSQMTSEIHRINVENPSLNPTQSAIVRAAINRRLLGFYKKVDQESTRGL